MATTTTRLSAYRQSALPLLGAELNSLAHNANSAAGSIVDLTGSRDVFVAVELLVAAQGSARSAGASVVLYALHSLDGANFDTTHELAGEPLVVWSLDATTSAWRSMRSRIELPPGLWKPMLRNLTGQAFASSGNTVRLRSFTLEAVG